MSVLVALHDITPEADEVKVLSKRESERYIKDFWLFNHKECCGLVDKEQMESYFIEMVPEHAEDELDISEVEYVDTTFAWLKKL